MIADLELLHWVVDGTLAFLAAQGLGPAAADPSTEIRFAFSVLALAGLFALKHFICDFLLQTGWQAANKGRYGHPGGVLHALTHVAGTAPLLLGAPLSLIATLLLAEFVYHYHVDWSKEQITRRAAWSPKQHKFWIAIGFDQLLHGLSYLAIIAALLFSGGGTNG